MTALQRVQAQWLDDAGWVSKGITRHEPVFFTIVRPDRSDCGPVRISNMALAAFLARAGVGCRACNRQLARTSVANR